MRTCVYHWRIETRVGSRVREHKPDPTLPRSAAFFFFFLSDLRGSISSDGHPGERVPVPEDPDRAEAVQDPGGGSSRFRRGRLQCRLRRPHGERRKLMITVEVPLCAG